MAYANRRYIAGQPKRDANGKERKGIEQQTNTTHQYSLLLCGGPGAEQ